MGKILIRLLILFLAAEIGPELARGQVSPHAPLKWPCEACHTADSWAMRKGATFDHDSTRFLLTGQHESLKCVSCHRDLKLAGDIRFVEAASNCMSCHTDIHKGEVGDNCLRCHDTQAWQIPDMVERHQQTRFPLLGRHATATCQSCHSDFANHQYAGTPTACIGCHRNEYQETKNPDARTHKETGPARSRCPTPVQLQEADHQTLAS